MPTPLALTLARICRQRRTELGVTQAAVAAALDISRTLYVAIEGARANPSIQLLDRLGEALGLRWELGATSTIVPLSTPVRDALHARCTAYVARRLRAAGWLVLREVPIEDGRLRGWVDLLAFDPATGTLLVIEVKTTLDDIGRLERQVGWYERAVLSSIPEGWSVTSVQTWVLLLATNENDRSIARLGEALAQSVPGRAVAMRATLAGTPTGDRARGLALIDPHSRRRDWLIPCLIDGRRTPLPYQDHVGARRALGLSSAYSTVTTR